MEVKVATAKIHLHLAGWSVNVEPCLSGLSVKKTHFLVNFPLTVTLKDTDSTLLSGTF